MGVAGQGNGQDYFAKTVASSNDAIESAKLELRAAEESRDSYKRELAGESAGAAARGTDRDARLRRPGDRRAHRGAEGASSTSCCARTPISIPDVVGTRRVIAAARGAAPPGRSQARAKAACADRQTDDRCGSQSGVPADARVARRRRGQRRVAARQAVGSYESQYAQLKAAAQLVPQVEAEFAQLNRDYDIQKKTYETLLQRRAVRGDGQGRAGHRRHAIPRHRSTARLAAAGAADANRAARHRARGGAGCRDCWRASSPASSCRRSTTRARCARSRKRPILGMVSMLPSEALNRSRRRNALLFRRWPERTGRLIRRGLRVRRCCSGASREEPIDEPDRTGRQAARGIAPRRRRNAGRRRVRARRAVRVPTAVEHVPTPEASMRALDARGASLRRRPRRAATAPPHPPDAGRRAGARTAAGRHRPRTPQGERASSRPTLRSRRSPTNSASSSGRSFATPVGTAARRIRNGNLIMVTSALPGEGKTFTAINLAHEHRDGARHHRAAGRRRRRASVDFPRLLGTPHVARPARPADARRPRRRRRASCGPTSRTCRCFRPARTIGARPSFSPASRWPACCASSRTRYRGPHRHLRFAAAARRRPKRACWPRTWDRSSWSSPPTATSQHAVNQALATIERLRDRADDAEQGGQDRRRHLLWLLRG